jgi:type I site-specific restriction endonuclease
VRQNIIQFLIREKNVPETLIAVEKSLTLNQLTKRTDAVVYASSGKPLMIVECKAPGVKINQKVFEQIARYNLSLKVNYLMVSNGLEHYCAHIDFAKGEFTFLEDIPEYESLKFENWKAAAGKADKIK